MPVLRVHPRLSNFVATLSRGWVYALAAVWLAAAAAGLAALWSYDNTPGEAASAPERWPSASTLARAKDRPTLVMLAHPRCTCTRASLAELAEALARARTLPRTYVLFMAPVASEQGWDHTDLWRTAAGLPGVAVVRDEGGRLARQFGAVTSGQMLAYDERGALVFSGGITAARGHAGDNAGRHSLVALLNHEPTERSWTTVFGCRLFNAGS